MNNELNERIAVEVMGLTNHPQKLCHVIEGMPFLSREWPDYSGNIADAWRVVEHFEKRLDIGTVVIQYGRGEWWCKIWHEPQDIVVVWHDITAPLAICHAALDIVAKMRRTP